MGKAEIMVTLDESKFYDLDHLKRDLVEFCGNVERVGAMYKRMSSVLAKHVGDDESMKGLLRINKLINMSSSNCTTMLQMVEECIRLESEFPWE